jgi:hypothetical protein
MRCWLSVPACLLILGSAEIASAQGTARGGNAPAAGHVTDAGASPAPLHSRLRFDPTRQPDISQRPGVIRHGGQRPFGVVTLWPIIPLVPPPVAVPLPVDSGLRGGVQLDVQPWRSQVYVDGTYAGIVEDFKGYYNHLELTAGPHVITIVAADHNPLTLEITITPGRTITHRATLNRN